MDKSLLFFLIPATELLVHSYANGGSFFSAALVAALSASLVFVFATRCEPALRFSAKFFFLNAISASVLFIIDSFGQSVPIWQTAFGISTLLTGLFTFCPPAEWMKRVFQFPRKAFLVVIAPASIGLASLVDKLFISKLTAPIAGLSGYILRALHRTGKVATESGSYFLHDAGPCFSIQVNPSIDSIGKFSVLFFAVSLGLMLEGSKKQFWAFRWLAILLIGGVFLMMEITLQPVVTFALGPSASGLLLQVFGCLSLAIFLLFLSRAHRWIFARGLVLLLLLWTQPAPAVCVSDSIRCASCVGKWCVSGNSKTTCYTTSACTTTSCTLASFTCSASTPEMPSEAAPFFLLTAAGFIFWMRHRRERASLTNSLGEK